MTDRLANVEVVVFDWDGTLVDSVEPKIKQNTDLASKFGHHLTNDKVRELWQQAGDFNELMQLLCPGEPIDEVRSIIAEGYNNPEYAKRNFGMEVIKIIEMIKSYDLEVALATSLSKDLLNKDSTDLSIPLDMFHYVQTADDTKYKKPDGRFFDPLIAYFGRLPQYYAYVGDEVKDTKAAQSAGIYPIGVLTGMSTRSELNRAGAELIVDDVGKLLFKL